MTGYQTAGIALGRYRGFNGNFVLVARRRCKADRACQPVEGGGESLIEAIEQRALLSRNGGIAGKSDRTKTRESEKLKTKGKRR
jgi:hypothetical protein